MSRSTLLLVFVFSLLTVPAIFAGSQPIPDPPGNALDQFFSKTSVNAPIYNGRQQERYEALATNHPYLVTQAYEPATISFDGIVYRNVSTRYDIFRDELLVNPPDSPYNIVLSPGKTDYALLHSYKIVYIDGHGVPQSGYYYLLSDGHVPVYEKPYAATHMEVTDHAVLTTYLKKSRYYIVIHDKWNEVRNFNYLIKLLDISRSTANEILTGHRLDYKSAPDRCIIALVKYYEETM